MVWYLRSDVSGAVQGAVVLNTLLSAAPPWSQWLCGLSAVRPRDWAYTGGYRAERAHGGGGAHVGHVHDRCVRFSGVCSAAWLKRWE